MGNYTSVVYEIFILRNALPNKLVTMYYVNVYYTIRILIIIMFIIFLIQLKNVTIFF